MENARQDEDFDMLNANPGLTDAEKCGLDGRVATLFSLGYTRTDVIGSEHRDFIIWISKHRDFIKSRPKCGCNQQVSKNIR